MTINNKIMNTLGRSRNNSDLILFLGLFLSIDFTELSLRLPMIY